MGHSADMKADLARLERALGLVEEILSEPLPLEGQPNQLALARETRLRAADRLVSLLERRAALLGLDAATGKNAQTDSGIRPGSIAELEQKLALVEKNRAS